MIDKKYTCRQVFNDMSFNALDYAGLQFGEEKARRVKEKFNEFAGIVDLKKPAQPQIDAFVAQSPKDEDEAHTLHLMKLWLPKICTNTIRCCERFGIEL